jgi:hypothetical protein
VQRKIDLPGEIEVRVVSFFSGCCTARRAEGCRGVLEPAGHRHHGRGHRAGVDFMEQKLSDKKRGRNVFKILRAVLKLI